jgi:cell division protein FtsW (lipid II flippase)
MAILLFYFGGSERDARPIRTQLPILGMLLLILLPVMLLLCLPGFAGLLQCMPISLSVLVLSSLSMPIYAFFCFVCARLRLKMQRLIRKYFPMERG